MALHSLTGDSRVGNVRRRPVVENPSKSSSKGNASSSTSSVIVNSRPINAKPDVQPVPDLKSAMVVRPTSRTPARGFRLPVSPKSILKSVAMGLALFAKGVSASNIPNCTGPAEDVSFYALNICGDGNRFIDGCVFSNSLQDNMDALYVNSPSKVNGTNMFEPNMTKVNFTEYGFNLPTYLELVGLQSAGTVNGCNDQEQHYLQDYCLPYVCKVYNDFVDLVGQTLAPSPSPT
ncbi:MAG: hypothetical protein VXX85_06610, partial [Candidatus Margulisiibacteriota bacterium]|nr:hypothetical protein [Candidatus Margulisiibacteriota bacterium]